MDINIFELSGGTHSLMPAALRVVARLSEMLVLRNNSFRSRVYLTRLLISIGRFGKIQGNKMLFDLFLYIYIKIAGVN